MLRVDVHERLGVLEAINHEFFMIERQNLQELEFKYQTLKNLEKFWSTVQLKNEIKDFGHFMASAQFPATLCEKIFEESEEKKAKNLKQMCNGLSYITDDLTLARFVHQVGFPEGFTDAANVDPNAPEEFKITAANVSNHFLMFYETTYKKQLSHPFEYFRNQKNDEKAIETINSCIRHAFNYKEKELDPKVESLKFEELVEAIVVHGHDGECEELPKKNADP